ncbi:MAG: hypothetical protein ACK56I_06625, partial [bacterium]
HQGSLVLVLSSHHRFIRALFIRFPLCTTCRAFMGIAFWGSKGGRRDAAPWRGPATVCTL